MSSKKALITKTSTPSFHEFNPKYIPWQYRLWHDVDKKYDFSTGVHYVLMSGSVGSAKSLEGAALAIRHVTNNPGARCCLGRKALPDLKDTIFTKILEMLHGTYIEKVDYWVRHENGYIKFANGSEIISRSWSDRKYKKFRSLELSMLLIEELTENDKRDWDFFEEAIARVERLPHIEENLCVFMTNPDDPSHPAHEFFIEGSVIDPDCPYVAHKTDDDGLTNIHTYYSLTEQNPFLKPSYIKGLRKRYDAKMIERMLMGKWIFISTDVIYHQYGEDSHVFKNLQIDKQLPLRFGFDFNISKGKPMSSCVAQFYPKARNKKPHTRRFKFLDEVAIEGARTEDACEEWAGKGWFDLPHNPTIIIHGDATGKSGSSKSKYSDYEIIEKYIANYRRKDGQKLNYEIEVPANGQNPPVRDRHNTANGQLRNADGEEAVSIDEECKLVRKGFLQTRLKENAGYIEDQTTEGQDMSNAATYLIHWCMTYEMDEEEEIEFL